MKRLFSFLLLGRLALASYLPFPASAAAVATNAAGQPIAATTNGTGSTVILQGSPTLTTPNIGVATATSVNKVTITAPVTGSSLTIADGKTLTANNSITIAGVDGKTFTLNNSLTHAGTDATTQTFPSVSATIPRVVASGTSALGTGSISSGACAAAVTTSATGTFTTDDFLADFNADPTGTTGYQASASGMLTIIKYPTANNVNFAVCNNTASSVTPGAITLNWRVVR